jgi:diguanylate cyclase (GGDEF)-like protein/PAS domain S-box-containing protein
MEGAVRELDRGTRQDASGPLGEDPACSSAFDAMLEKFAATSAYSSECMFVLDAEWRFRHLNHRAIEEIAQGRDLLGQIVWDAFPSARASDFGAFCTQATSDGMPQSFEAHSPSLGSWYEVHAAPLAGGLLVSFRNINARKVTEQRLREAQERYQLAALATENLIYDWDLAAGRIEWSAALGSRFGYHTQELGATIEWWEDLIHPEDRARITTQIQEVISRQHDRLDCLYRWRRADGSYAEVHDRGYLMKDATGELVRMVGAMQDLTGERAAQSEASRARNLLQTVIDSAPDHIFVKDVSGRFVLTNRTSAADPHLPEAGAAALFRADLAAAIGRAESEVTSSPAARTVEEVVHQEGQTRVFQSVEVPWCENGEIKGVIGISRDITHQKTIDERVRWCANHDALTGLPNRAFLQTHLSERIVSADDSEPSVLALGLDQYDGRSDASGDAPVGTSLGNARPFALLLLDIDDFKRINDTLGHDTGDALLCALAERLSSATGDKDVVARLGGDEFAIILSDVQTEEQLDAALASILAELKEPCVHDGKILDCQASIGASLYPAMGRDKTELMKNADIALYAAKEAGRGTGRIFQPVMRAEMQKRNSMLSLARHAIDADLITPFYQPKIDMRTGMLAGFEALLRWRHPVHGIQSPDTITAAFADPVLGADISDRMIDAVIKDLRAWRDAGVNFGHVAVNAAAAEFRRGAFAEKLLSRLAAAEVPTSCFQLEVTETVFLGRGAEYVDQALRTLSAGGVKIALDDFGTGFAALSHLKQFPVDIIKIDCSFIRDLHDDPDDEAIVRAVINLGKSLAIKVVAEGIETPAQSAYLRKHDCDYGQGYLFAPALPFARIPDLVTAMAARANRLRATYGEALSVDDESKFEDLVTGPPAVAPVAGRSRKEAA